MITVGIDKVYYDTTIRYTHILAILLSHINREIAIFLITTAIYLEQIHKYFVQAIKIGGNGKGDN